METRHMQLLAEWYRRVVLSSQSHYNNAQRLGRLNLALGIPVICLSTAVATTAFATQDLFVSMGIALGLASLLAAILASLQTFLGFSERAEQHRTFGAKYGSLRREIEALLAREQISDAEFDAISSDLLKRMDALAEQAPHIPSRVWFRTEKRYINRFKTRFPDALMNSQGDAVTNGETA